MLEGRGIVQGIYTILAVLFFIYYSSLSQSVFFSLQLSNKITIKNNMYFILFIYPMERFITFNPFFSTRLVP